MSFVAALEVEVSHAITPEVAQGQRLFVAAKLFLPSSRPLREVPAVLACLNGGTYDWRYYHAEINGHHGYSMAQHIADLGNIVLVLDHLGVGDSSRVVDQHKVDRNIAAAANHAALHALYEHLRGGTLHPSLPAIQHFIKAGAGHSMGAMQTITQQARHRTYDRIAVLGYTAVGVHLHLNGQVVSADPGPLDFSAPGHVLVDRQRLRQSFHWDDVPEAVIAADDALNVEVPYVLMSQSITGGIVIGDIKQIEVPVYICLGERDVSPDPHMEPYYYRSSPEVTLHLLKHSGHCQNFASSRTAMWDRINSWMHG